MADTINERIARCRKLANLTQTEAAEKMGMKCSTYSQMERKGSISVEKLLNLASIFNVNPAILIYGEKEAQKATGFSNNNEGYGNVLMQDNFLSETQNPSAFIASKNEENIIKIYRSLPKEKKAELKEFLNKLYHESK